VYCFVFALYLYICTCMDTTLHPADHYFLKKEEPVKSFLLTLRTLILQYDPGIREEWKYRMPFYTYRGKMCCYLWTKKNGRPYLGIVEGKRIEHPLLIQEKRARMKILLFDPTKNIPIKDIRQLLKKVLSLYP
jgi:hypothetical protein